MNDAVPSLDFPDCTALLKALAGHQEMQRFAIGGNVYVSRCSLALMKLLAHPFSQLRTLDISNCYISGRGAHTSYNRILCAGIYSIGRSHFILLVPV
jgi:Ran GTPase-activating protein (RanGAP) involved in mRNA processing and transport